MPEARVELGAPGVHGRKKAALSFLNYASCFAKTVPIFVPMLLLP